MKPRKRKFKRDNKLKLAYVKEHPEFGSDFMGIVPLDEPRRWDLYLLFSHFLYTPIAPKEYDTEKKIFIEHPSLIQELKNRGYDVETLYFEIEKQGEPKENDTSLVKFRKQLFNIYTLLDEIPLFNVSNASVSSEEEQKLKEEISLMFKDFKKQLQEKYKNFYYRKNRRN